jgi:hypothetical protein
LAVINGNCAEEAEGWFLKNFLPGNGLLVGKPISGRDNSAVKK